MLVLEPKLQSVDPQSLFKYTLAYDKKHLSYSEYVTRLDTLCGGKKPNVRLLCNYLRLDNLCHVLVRTDPQLMHLDRASLYNATLMYLFRGLNYAGYGARLTRLNHGIRPNVRAITDALGRDGAVMKNLKVWIFYVVKHRSDRKTQLKLARDWSIDPIDVQAFDAASTKTVRYIRKLGRRYAALTMDKLEHSVTTIVSQTQTWLGKFVSRKLRFIVQSQGMHRSDIEHELVYKGIQGLYAMYPRVESQLHATNVVKRVIHNQGINMIHHYTTKKMGRLIVDGTGAWHSRVISLDDAQLNTVAAPEASDLHMDFSLVLHRYTGKRRQFLELLSGAYCERFTSWLCEKGHVVETNEILLDRMDIRKYVRLALEHLNVEWLKGVQFLQELRKTFEPYRTGVMA